MDSGSIILLGISIYVLIMIGVAVYASRESHTLTDFVVAGRNMPLWLCSVSIFATWFGGAPMMGAATAAYEGDILLMVGEPFGSAVCLLITGLFFARIYRRTRRLTWVEFFEARYGRLAGLMGGFADIVGGLIWLGGMLFTFGVVFESLTGAPLAFGILGGLLVVVTYTMIGGMWAVAMTDFIQMVVIVVGLVALLIVVLVDAGGWAEIYSQLPDKSLRLAPVEHTVTNWIDHIHVWLALGLAAIASSSVIQRALSARNESVAQNGFYLAGLGYLTIGLIPLALGFAAQVTMPDMEDPNAAITELAIRHFHPVLVAVFAGAILSALMSTSDSILLAISSIISTNFVPVFNKNASASLRLRIARLSMPVSGLIATYVAFNAARVVEVIIDSVGALLAGIIVPFVLCFWWPRANRAGALAGIVCGWATWIGAFLAETQFPPDMLGFLVSIVAMIGTSLLTQKIDPPRPLTGSDGEVVELENRLGKLWGSGKASRHA
jgi:SSS family transporter